jgi:hypothetical protein
VEFFIHKRRAFWKAKCLLLVGILESKMLALGGHFGKQNVHF